jgi:uncharacterized Ntn-hydrolase superfamily protein
MIMRSTHLFAAVLVAAAPLPAQEPASWGTGDVPFHTFSIAAVDTATREVGVAVTTRVACVGNGVPWVRTGVGAVATQASTRVAYGVELLDMLAEGMAADDALREAMADDERAATRQVGVIGLDAGHAQHTGDSTFVWAGHRAGATYVTQGNLLEGPRVIDAVATTFEASEGTHRHLADRLIDALAAGQAAGGDARKGRAQSAAVIVADARPGVSRRPDGVTVHINVCEHPTPVAELRRIHDAISQTLGFRRLEMFSGRDVWQLKVMLHALGYYRADADSLVASRSGFLFDPGTVTAVDAFRADMGFSTPTLGSPPGLVDSATVQALWRELEGRGLAADVRQRLLQWTQIRR